MFVKIASSNLPADPIQLRNTGKHAAMLLAVCLCAGCGSGSKHESIEPVTTDLLPQSQALEIAHLVYDATYDVPYGFYVDERASTAGSYSIHHVKDASISFELCADTAVEAATIEQKDNDSRSVRGDLTATTETEQYFEFVRELDYSTAVGNVPGPTSSGFGRVFKCSFVRREGVDRNLRSGFGGQLNALPLDQIDVRNFVEYLWQFTFFWPAQKKVIASRIDEDNEAFQHTLSVAFKYNQGAQACDLVEVVDWVFTVAKTDGAIWRAFVPVNEFESELVNGSVRICSGG